MRLNPVFCVIGAPGSGKSTLARQLATHMNMTYLGMSVLLSEHPTWKSNIGTGDLAPDDLVIDLLLDNLMPVLGQKPVILDGFPRTLVQKVTLEQHLMAVWPEYQLHTMVIDVSPALAVKRLMTRGEGRTDDTPKIIQKRQAEFERTIKPIFEMAKLDQSITVINGDSEPEVVLINASRVMKDLVFGWWLEALQEDDAAADARGA